ncbi:T9SS type A sorting domain-containing protein [Pedobacter sp. BS3]|uniref:T9SS type A sorting domain-containing protein n=1 Tax=Pedobacter sp. BS3 TaxID=2567937 RepID=UPI0011F098EF|nr:T9SS type A sorting domain-containing protein [Pedobacter sp. BS3]TZF82273.1 T9SS type A sorting domain-containing protein [Pedobacter sp. BS3]
MKKKLTLCMALLSAVSAYSQSFSPGNLLIVRSGDNSTAPVSGTYSTIYLDEYTTGGVLVNTHTVSGLVGDGGSTNEGYYQLSPNGMYLAVGGYAKNAGDSRTIATNGTGDLAKIQLYGSSGTSSILKSYTLPAGVFSTGDGSVAGNVTNARLTGTVALNDGTGLYAGGGSANLTTGGVFYINNNAGTGNVDVFNQVQTTQSNLRVPGIFSGQLYTSGNAAALGNAAAIRLGEFSTAIPTTASGATVTNLLGADFSVATGSGGVPVNICQYVIYDANASIVGNDVLFATDDGTTAGHKGSIKKYVKNVSGYWDLKYEIYTGTDANDANNLKFRGLVGQLNATGNATLYATAYDPVNSVYKVLKFTDPDIYNSTAAPGLTTLITAPSANYIFKGISFTPGSTLPLKLTSFNAVKKLNTVALSWTTESELNTDKFIIERSLDGQSFTPVNTVPAKNTSGTHTYSGSDAINFSGVAYYRLKMLDLDGSYTYSEVKSVKNADSYRFSVYPNPATDKLTIRHENITNKAAISIIQADGKVVLKTIAQPNTTETTLYINKLPQGAYILKLEINGQPLSQTFIKE